MDLNAEVFASSTVDAPMIGVVVVNFGTSGMLQEHLRPLSRRSDCRIYIVDNFSSAQERSAVGDLCADHGWTLVQPNGNLGFGAGVNLGADHALRNGVSHLLLLNPDATIDSESLDRLLGAIGERARKIVAPRILRSSGAVWFEGMTVSLENGQMRSAARTGQYESMFWLTGACLLVPRDVWLELGGFDDRYFLYWEDVDLSIRATKRGIALAVVDDATVIHSVGGSQGTSARAKSTTYLYYNVRNRLVFAARHLDDAGIRRWMRTGVTADMKILLRGGRRPLLTSVRPWIAVLRGRRDGRARARERLRVGRA